MKPRLLVCDWNGTLLNDLWLAYVSTKAIFEAYGVPAPTLLQYQNEIESDFSKFYIQHGITQFDFDFNNRMRRKIFEENWDKVELHDPVMAKHILVRVKQLGLRLAIVSAEIPDVLARRMAQFGLEDVFDCVVGGAWPKNAALRDVLVHFDVKPEETFYIDDTLEGISIAKKLGIRTIGFTEGYNTRQQIVAAKPTYVVNSLAEMLSILQGWVVPS
ncbi:MAG: HAD family hydrolase [Parcubacteria group bacterium]|nr:HAD family hydrolase [Parcubacteria group bacterium]